MAQSSYAPLGNPVAILSPQFCTPCPLDLTIVSNGKYAVTDDNGNVMFKIKGKVFSLRNRSVLLDAAGNPVLTLQPKTWTAHMRWQVYRGDSTDAKDLLFTVKETSLIQFKTQFDVFLAANTKQDVCDFKIKGSWLERSITIFLGDTSTIIAQMHRKHSVQSVLGKHTLAVTVYPNVDYAFVVALVVVLEEIKILRTKAAKLV